jgi:uncharacterized membrane protein
MKNWQLWAILSALLAINSNIAAGLHTSNAASTVSAIIALVFAFLALRGYISDKNL